MKKKIFDDELRASWRSKLPEDAVDNLEKILADIAEPPVPESLRYSLIQQVHNKTKNRAVNRTFYLAPALAVILLAFVAIYNRSRPSVYVPQETAALVQELNDDDTQVVFDDDLFFDDSLFNLEENV